MICTQFIYENTNAQSEVSHTDRYIPGFVSSGDAALERNDEKLKITRGSAFFINRDSRFKITGDVGLSYFYISFYGRRADELIQHLGLSNDYCVFDLSKRYDKLNSFAFNCLNRANKENTDIISECVLLYLISYLTTQNNKSSNLLSSMITLTKKTLPTLVFR